MFVLSVISVNVPPVNSQNMKRDANRHEGITKKTANVCNIKDWKEIFADADRGVHFDLAEHILMQPSGSKTRLELK